MISRLNFMRASIWGRHSATGSAMSVSKLKGMCESTKSSPALRASSLSFRYILGVPEMSSIRLLVRTRCFTPLAANSSIAAGRVRSSMTPQS